MKVLYKNDNTKIININKPIIQNENDVIVEVKLGAICRTDTYVYLNTIEKNNIILGHEVSGIIISKGNNVTHLSIGDKVSINPFIGCGHCEHCKEHNFQLCPDQKMCGVETDGLFSKYILINKENVIKFNDIDFKKIAFFEPVLAISAVLNTGIKKEDKVLIYGDNRIAKLTQLILNINGFNNVDCFIPEIIEQKYDFVVETMPNTLNFNNAVKCLKNGGTLILKSRIFHKIDIDLFYILKHNIKIVPAYYYNNIEHVVYMIENQLPFENLIGETYDFEDYDVALRISLQAESLKTYLRID